MLIDNHMLVIDNKRFLENIQNWRNNLAKTLGWSFLRGIFGNWRDFFERLIFFESEFNFSTHVNLYKYEYYIISVIEWSC